MSREGGRKERKKKNLHQNNTVSQLTKHKNQIASTKAGKLRIKGEDVKWYLPLSFSSHFFWRGVRGWGGAGECAHVRACARRQAGLAASCDKSYPERLFILVLPLELKQECWSPLKPNT